MLNRFPHQLQLKQGLAADINTTATKNLAVQGEPHWTTDTNQLYVFDGNNNVRFHGLDLVVMYENNIVGNNNEIVWNY